MKRRKNRVLVFGIATWIITAQQTSADQPAEVSNNFVQDKIVRLLKTANDLVHDDEPKKAQTALNTAVTLYEKGAENGTLGCYQRASDVSEIKSQYESSLDLLPGEALIRCDYATFLESTGSKKQALSYFRKAAQIEPANRDVWVRLAECCMRQARYREAMDALRKFGNQTAPLQIRGQGDVGGPKHNRFWPNNPTDLEWLKSAP